MRDCDCASCTVCEPAEKVAAEHTCPDCGAGMTAGSVDDAWHRDGRVLLIRHIPTTLCPQCGYYFFTVETACRLAGQFEVFVNGGAPCGVEDFED